MNLNFDEFEQCDADSNNPSNQEHGRYQLLSAYLDGEVTVDERRQVQEWLDSDVKKPICQMRFFGFPRLFAEA